MRRQEILINLFLLAVIAGLAFMIFQQDDEAARIEAPNQPVAVKRPPGEETDYNREIADQKYNKLGKTELFRALQTPTPTPPPPTPTPTPTPNIQAALGSWSLVGLDRGIATIEDKAKPGAEDQFFDIKTGESRPVQADNQVRQATLVRVDESFENPSVTFQLEGTTDEHTIKMFPEAAAPPQ